MSNPHRMNATDLEKALAKETGHTIEQAHDFLSALRDIVAREVAAGRSIALTNFGTWRAQEVPARPRRNPQTGETYMADAFQAVQWRTSPRLAEIVRARDTTATARKRPSGPSRQQQDT